MRFHPLVLSAPLALLLIGSAEAQAPTNVPTAPAPGPTTPGAPGTIAPQSGATGAPGAVTGTPTGQPADTISNSSSAAGNAGQPERAAPQGGGTGK